MTPQKKAQYLVDKFTPHVYGVWDENGSKEERYHAKQCALIAINELIFLGMWTEESIGEYWRQVKQEIEKL